MANPTMSNIPGMSAMTGTFDFVKNLWGGMNMPGMVMPTLSLEDINKQISDLKAVESWLTLNMNMLRGTIQALEVQSATISTLQSMGETLSAAVKSSAEAKPQVQSSQGPAHEPEPPAPVKVAPQVVQIDATDSSEQGAKSLLNQANPTAWWNMLQDQFKQAVTAAMAAEPAKPESPPPTSGTRDNAGNVAPRKPKAAVKKTASKAAPKRIRKN
jgi:hypothetical protein